MNLCYIQEGFSSVQKHIITKLTSTSNSMGSDPIYICHCYDIMVNLAAPRNDTILVINRGLNFIEDEHDNLGVRGIEDSSILGPVDSKQMVENICTPQKYISWSYF